MYKGNGGGKQTEGRQLRVYFCIRDVVIAESLACLKSVPRAQFPANKRRALSAHTCPIWRRRSFPLAPRAELRLNWLSAATRPGCLNHGVALIEPQLEGGREGGTAARVSGLFVSERRPVTTKQEVDAASSNTEQMPNQISIMMGGQNK